jgi:hypothetical protein
VVGEIQRNNKESLQICRFAIVSSVFKIRINFHLLFENAHILVVFKVNIGFAFMRTPMVEDVQH